MFILVVDDDPDMLEMIEDAVRSQGHQTCGFTSCQAALDALVHQKIDCVICDIVMPDMTGEHLYELAQKVKADLPFLFVTGASSVSQRLAEATQVFILFKPFHLGDLFEAVDRLTGSLTGRNKILSA